MTVIKKAEIKNTLRTTPMGFWSVVVAALAVKSVLLLFLALEPKPINLLALVMSLPVLALLSSFGFLLRGKGSAFYWLVLDLVLSALFFVDLLYTRGFGHLPSAYVLFAQNTINDLHLGISSLIRWWDWVLFLDLPFLALFMGIPGTYGHAHKSVRAFLAVFLAGVLTLGIQSFILWQGRLLGDVASQPAFLSPVEYHAYDMLQYFFDGQEDLSAEESARVSAWLEANKKYLDGDPRYQALAGSLKGKNLIVIQVESLENILIGLKVDGVEITPNLNRLAGNGLYFSGVHEQVRDGNSSDAELLFNTSVYPLQRGSAFMTRPGTSYDALPGLLGGLGYDAVALHGDNAEFWNRHKVYPVLGFGDYVSEDKFVNQEILGMGLSDASLFDQALIELEKADKPCYLYSITLTSHMPFYLPEEAMLPGFSGRGATNNYLESMRYTDACIGDFVKALEDGGYMENSVLVVYGDHEGVHKYYRTDLPDNSQEIPFIVVAEGLPHLLIHKDGGQVDMLPTLAWLMGLDPDTYYGKVMGRNLLGPHGGSAMLSDGTLVPGAEDPEHLTQSGEIADLIIRGNYFGK
jgi:phosphoglycerol transferase MdoB-like AlkP superfamily enzyme